MDKNVQSKSLERIDIFLLRLAFIILLWESNKLLIFGIKIADNKHPAFTFHNQIAEFTGGGCEQ